MALIFGIALILLSACAFYFSLPRHGKTARFVGTEWEGYAVVSIIAVFGTGIIMVISDLANW